MLKNIEACEKISEIIKTSLGPNGKRFDTKKYLNLFRNEKNGC